MTCPHKYTGRNPGVEYPKLRTLEETAAWHINNNTAHRATVCEHYLSSELKPRGPVEPVESWPRAEVEALIKAAGRVSGYHFTMCPVIWGGRGRQCDCGIQDIIIALDALKGKMG